MTEAEAFLQRVRAFPDDDTPRLIFADWLEEQDGGVARATFIRVQVALTRLGDEADTVRDRLRAAERDLLDAHREEWTAAFRGLATGLEFRRGFVEEVKVAARPFVRRAHELFAAAPVRHVHLLDAGSSLDAALRCPYLSRLTALTVYAQHAGEPLARAVAGSEHLSGLKALHLGRNRLEDDAADHLAGSAVLANLEELDLAENELGETGAAALAASPHLGGLRRLELGGNRLGPAGAEALGASERLAGLHRLGLRGNEVGAGRLYTLTRASELLRVPELDLSANGLTAAGLRVLLTRRPGPAAVRLRDLDLGHNAGLGDDGARVLAGCPHLAGVRALRLSDCGVGNDGARALAESPYLDQLATLDLSNNPVGDPGFRAFLDTPHLRSLCRLTAPTLGVSSRMQHALDARFRRGPGLPCPSPTGGYSPGPRHHGPER
ncbi:MAG: hypothetical protein C0501_02125 [Isosphaera sp.]|nr:hypothetical protein [Isosphaera sp.]